MEKLPASLKVWTLFGVGNNRRYINMNKVYDVLGSKKCSDLPVFHALTGCDFNPAFYRKGKRKPWELYSANEDFQEAFIALQSPDSDNYESAFTTLEDFVCKMYSTAKNGLRKCSNVDEARLRIFTQTYTNKIEPTDRPCKRELQQLLRAAYIGHTWKKSFTPVPNDWKLQNNSYSFRWFEGDDILPNVQEIIEAPKESGANDEEVLLMYPNFDDEEDDESNNDDDSGCQSDIGYTTEEESVHSRDDDDDNDNVDNDDEAFDDNDIMIINNTSRLK